MFFANLAVMISEGYLTNVHFYLKMCIMYVHINKKSASKNLLLCT